MKDDLIACGLSLSHHLKTTTTIATQPPPSELRNTQTDIETHTDRLSDTQTDKGTHRHIKRHTDIHRDKQADRDTRVCIEVH